MARKLKLPTHLAGGNWQIELGAMVVVCVLALGCSFVAKAQVDKLSQENDRWKVQLAETEIQLAMSRSDLDNKSRALAVVSKELAALKVADKNLSQTADADVDAEARASAESGRVDPERENYLLAPGRYERGAKKSMNMPRLFVVSHPLLNHWADTWTANLSY